ncbi:MAG: M23 family metallopeptidase [Rhodospirillales bacterium]
MFFSSERRIRRQLANLGLAGLIGTLSAVSAHAETPPAPDLVFPLDCSVATNCVPLTYVDHLPGPGVRDYKCGLNAREQSGLTHIALQSLADVDRSIPVLAAAPGKVRGTRDGIRDEGPEYRDADGKSPPFCGNAVEILHQGGWISRYCHMREGSILVKAGDDLKPGNVIGYAGWSGNAPMPGLGFRLKQEQTVLDPFNGKPAGESCTTTGESLWSGLPPSLSDYRDIIVIDAGFSSTPQPLLPDIIRGYHRQSSLPVTAPSLVFWVLIGNVRPGEQRTLQIVGPDDRVIAEQKHLERDASPVMLLHTGAARPEKNWMPGTYSASVVISREVNGQMVHINRHFDIEVR